MIMSSFTAKRVATLRPAITGIVDRLGSTTWSPERVPTRTCSHVRLAGALDGDLPVARRPVRDHEFFELPVPSNRRRYLDGGGDRRRIRTAQAVSARADRNQAGWRTARICWTSSSPNRSSPARCRTPGTGRSRLAPAVRGSRDHGELAGARDGDAGGEPRRGRRRGPGPGARRWWRRCCGKRRWPTAWPASRPATPRWVGYASRPGRPWWSALSAANRDPLDVPRPGPVRSGPGRRVIT